MGPSADTACLQMLVVKMRSCWSEVGPQFNMTGVLRERGNLDMETNMRGGKKFGHGDGHAWREDRVKTRERSRERGLGRILPSQPREGTDLPTLRVRISSLRSRETLHFCCLIHPACGSSLSLLLHPHFHRLALQNLRQIHPISAFSG